MPPTDHSLPHRNTVALMASPSGQRRYRALMSARLPRRVLRDWHPDTDPPEEDWLADQYDHGWVPDHFYGASPATVSIDGHPPVHRWAMVEIPAGEDQPPTSY